MIAERTLDRLYGDGFVVAEAAAARLAVVRTHAAGHRRHRIALQNQTHGCLDLAGPQLRQVEGDGDPGRAVLGAAGQPAAHGTED